MASRTSRREWMRGLPSAFGVGRQECKRAHWASERSVGYVFLIGDSVRNILTLSLTKQALRCDAALWQRGRPRRSRSRRGLAPKTHRRHSCPARRVLYGLLGGRGPVLEGLRPGDQRFLW